MIELLVVIGVITLISTIVFTGWRTGEHVLALERSAHQLAQDIARVRELSTRAEYMECSAGGSIKGYGIEISVNQDPKVPDYVLFVNCSEQDTLDTSGFTRDAQKDLVIYDGEKYLPERISVSDGDPGLPLTITFYPPDPRVKISFGPPSYENHGTVTLALVAEDSGMSPIKTMDISVYKSGLIEVY